MENSWNTGIQYRIHTVKTVNMYYNYVDPILYSRECRNKFYTIYPVPGIPVNTDMVCVLYSCEYRNGLPTIFLWIQCGFHMVWIPGIRVRIAYPWGWELFLPKFHFQINLRTCFYQNVLRDFYQHKWLQPHCNNEWINESMSQESGFVFYAPSAPYWAI